MFSVGCSGTAHKRSLGETIDDNVIVLKLKTKLMRDKVVKAGDIELKVKKNVVTMTGTVTSQEQIDRAIEIAEQQAGVKEVKAYLVLREMGGSAKPKTKIKGQNVVEEDLPSKEKSGEDFEDMEF